MRGKIALPLTAGLLMAASTAWAGRFDGFTKKYASNPDQAKVLAAGPLGGAGTEWLVGGGFQPDGTIVVAGVGLGPELSVAGQKASVLGQDTAAPAAPERRPLRDKAGKPQLDKAGNPKYEDFGWRHENATAFVALLSADAATVKRVVRFPWRAGSLTSAAVDASGAIYLAGSVGPELAKLGGEQQALPVGDAGTAKGTVEHTYLAKLSPTADAVQWVRTFAGPSNAPEVSVARDGKTVTFTGPDIRTFDAAGQQKSLTVVPGGLSGKSAVNPLDGTIARGGEHHWSTGREPWRCPTLNIYKPDGKLLYQLYDWGGPYVGLDNSRLVSDSAIRLVKYDAEGNLIIYAWSDGGNSCMYCEPNDIRRQSKKMGGLGMSAWGAGVLSCAYIIKIETRNYRISGGTLWLAYLSDKDKPNSIWIDDLGFGVDGAVCFAGRAAWGLIRTGNAIGGGEPTGPYVTVLSPDCGSIRFSSDMPACGKTDLNSDGGRDGRWGIISGSVNGKPRVLYLCGAAESEASGDKTLAPPFVKGPQAKFAGGHADGYFLLLDLSAP